MEGKSSFVPVVFEKEYMAMAMMTVHSALIEFRFRPLNKPNSFKVTTKEDKDSDFVVVMTEDDEEEERIR